MNKRDLNQTEKNLMSENIMLKKELDLKKKQNGSGFRSIECLILKDNYNDIKCKYTRFKNVTYAIYITTILGFIASKL